MASSATASIPPRKTLLLTATPRCTATNGHFFLTKALQSKLSFARARGWTLWSVGDGELRAAASTPPLHSVEPAVQWPGLVQQVISARLLGRGEHTFDWLVWIDAELLLLRPEAFRWGNLADEIDLVLVSARRRVRRARAASASDGANLPELDLSLAFARASESALALLAAWADALATSGASSSADAAGGLNGLRMGHPNPHLTPWVTPPPLQVS